MDKQKEDLEDGTIKGIKFEEIDDEWRLMDEVILLADNTIEAKHLEPQNYRYHKVCSEVEDKGQPYMPVKWVITVKHKGGEQLTKARLVAKGFEKEDKEKLSTDSPTCCKENLRVLCALIASNHLKIGTLDIISEFLQAQKFNWEIIIETD